MPVIIVPAILAGIASLFSGLINIILGLPNSIRLLVFYAVFIGLGISLPGTDINLGSAFLSPLFIATFGVFHVYMDYPLMTGVLGIILLLYYCHFLLQGWR